MLPDTVRPALVARAALVALAAALVACPSPPPPRDAAQDAAQDAVADAARGVTLVARFRTAPGGGRPRPFDVPFPSDVHRDADGTLADDLTDWSAIRVTRNGAALAEALRDLDGFARNAGAVFVVDGEAPEGAEVPELDRASLASATHLVDLEAPDAASARVPSVAGWHPRFRAVTVAPDGVVLAPGRRYVALLTSSARAASPSAPLVASPAFAAIRDDAPGARATPLGALYGPALDRALALVPGLDRARVVAAAVFTTHTRHRQLRAACAAVREGRYGPLPALSFDADVARPYTVARFGARPHAGWTATLTEWLGTPLRVGGRDVPGAPDEAVEPRGLGVAHDALGAVATGTFELPDFRGASGAFALGPDGAPAAAARAARIPVTFALPRGPVPPRGFPVVIWGHGLRGHRRHMLLLANEMARRGIATVAIDHVTFGQRTVPVDRASLEAGTYRGPDGIGDAVEYPELDFFGRLESLVAFRDNLRQAALDLVSLRRLLANPALDLAWLADAYDGATPALDPARVAYAGDSLGGLIGTLFGACEPGVNPVVLNVPGGAVFTAAAADAPVIGEVLSTVPPLLFGAPSGAPADRFHPVLQVLQTGIDAADPASHAADVTDGAGRGGRPHDAWVIESHWDEIIANRATELLARAMGLPQITPAATLVPGLARVAAPVRANLRDGATGGFFQCAPSTHGANVASRYGVRSFAPPFPREGLARYPRLAQGARVRQPVVALQRQIAAFLASAFEGRAEIAVDGMAPLADLDDDGWTDDEERAAGTDPLDAASRPPGTAPHARDVGF